MKKIYASLALVCFSIAGVFAQRHCDLKLVAAAPASNTVINCTDSFNMGYIFVNNGPDQLLTTDTLVVIDGEATLTNSWTYSLDAPVAVGDTAIFWSSKSHMNMTHILEDANSQFVAPPYANGNYKYPIIFSGFTDTTAVVDTAVSNNGALIPIVVNCATTGIGNTGMQKESLNVYPNPASSVINFSYNFVESSNATVKISDISGRVLLTKDLGKSAAGSKQFTLDVSDLSNGMYYIELLTNNKQAISKLTIRK